MNMSRSRKLFVHCRFKRLVNKYTVYKLRQKTLRANLRLRMLANKLLMKGRTRRAHFNLSRLSRRLL